jgi:hypothetical protein
MRQKDKPVINPNQIGLSLSPHKNTLHFIHGLPTTVQHDNGKVFFF